MVFLNVVVTSLTVSVVRSLETASSDMMGSGETTVVEDGFDFHKNDVRDVSESVARQTGLSILLTVVVVVLGVLLMALLRSRLDCIRLKKTLDERSFRLEVAEDSLAMLEKELENKLHLQNAATGRNMESPTKKMKKKSNAYILDTGMNEKDSIGAWRSQASEFSVEVETYLNDMNAMAIQEEQVDAWMSLERKYSKLKADLIELRAAVSDNNQSKTEQIQAVRFILEKI
jgi:Tfp pilus assembly protein PilX